MTHGRFSFVLNVSFSQLHEAIHAGQTEVVLYLLHEGVDIDKRTDEGVRCFAFIEKVRLGFLFHLGSPVWFCCSVAMFFFRKERLR
jgi:hypothetical protein